MSANITNQVAYLRTSRNFPNDLEQLCVESNKAYLDTANAINNRTISLFSVNVASINGESWFLTGNKKQQGFRQVYVFTSTANILHHITVVNPDQFVRGFGTYTDGTNSYGLYMGTSVAIAGQITFYLTATNIVFSVGAGAPALIRARITIEWISQP